MSAPDFVRCINIDPQHEEKIAIEEAAEHEIKVEKRARRAEREALKAQTLRDAANAAAAQRKAEDKAFKDRKGIFLVRFNCYVRDCMVLDFPINGCFHSLLAAVRTS